MLKMIARYANPFVLFILSSDLSDVYVLSDPVLLHSSPDISISAPSDPSM